MNGWPQDIETLIEAAASAFRERDEHGRIQPSPAWVDLSPAQREAAYERQLEARIVESAMSPEGQDATTRSVLARVRGLAQLPPEDGS